MDQQNGIRSRGTNDPKTDPGAVAIYTAMAGPPGPRLRLKYMSFTVKGAKSKIGGNSGGVGRAARRYKRGYGGGQISNEEKLRRTAQSTAGLAARGVPVPTGST